MPTEQSKETTKLLFEISEFEKELIHANNLLKQNTEQLKRALLLTIDKAKEIDSLSKEKSETAKAVPKALSEKKILQLFSQLSSSVKELKKYLADFDDQSTAAEVFLESFRNERSYFFSSEEQTISFLEQLFSLYTISAASFRPEFVGTIDLNDTAASLKLQKKDNQSLLVEAAKLQSLFSFLKKKNAAKNFLLQATEIKIVVKTPTQLKVEADNAKIKRLDRLAKEIEASFE